MALSFEGFMKSNADVWKKVSVLYNDALIVKSVRKKNEEAKNNLIQLDKWYQNDLPGILEKRKSGEIFITRPELAKLMQWKLSRGKFRPRLQQLVESNAEDDVQNFSKTSFGLLEKNNLKQAVETLSKLKGVGPATASAILSAGCPEKSAFMADESTQVVLHSSSLKYNLVEYQEFVSKLQSISKKLQKEDATGKWTLAEVEKTIWVFEVLKVDNASTLQQILNEDKSLPEKRQTEDDTDTDQPRTKSKRRK